VGEISQGRLDGYFETDDGEYIILDYKTGKTAKSSTYKDQMMLYALAIGQEKGLTLEEVTQKVKIYLFFPFAPGKWDRVLLDVLFTVEDLEDLEERKTCVMEEVEGRWEPAPTLSFMCTFCSFRGLNDYCPVSVAAGCSQQESGN
jgi:hypothetical protein